ncbi:MAG: HlyD family secretion protein [Planctomycetaceae bacterium]
MSETPTESVRQLPPFYPAPRTRTFVLVAIVLGFSVFLTGWADSEEEFATGRLAARTTDVLAETNGRVETWLVKPGADVGPDVGLLVIRDEGRAGEIAAVTAEIARLESEQIRRRAQAEVDLSWRLRSLNGEILKTQLKTAELLQQEYDRNIEFHAWHDALRKAAPGTRTASPDDVFRPVSHSVNLLGDPRLDAMRNHETARNAVEVARVQLLLCEDRLRELRELRRELPDRIRIAAGVEATTRQIAAAKERLRELETTPAQQELQADAYGRVRLLSKPGSHVMAGDVLARIVDDERRFLSVSVPAEKLARFQSGSAVQLRFPGDEQRRGRVAALRTAKKDGAPPTIIVQPTGRLWPRIPVGSAVQVLMPRD